MGLFSKALLSVSRGFLGLFQCQPVSVILSLYHHPGFVCLLFLLHRTNQSDFFFFFACLFISHNWNVSFVGSGTFCVLFIVISPTSGVVPGIVEAQRKTLIATVTCSVYRCGEMAVTAARNCGHFASSRAILSSSFQVPDLLAIR